METGGDSPDTIGVTGAGPLYRTGGTGGKIKTTSSSSSYSHTAIQQTPGLAASQYNEYPNLGSS